MNEPTPLPCPFCGSEPKVTILPKDGPGTSPLYYVACESAKCPCGPRVGLEGGSADSMLRSLLSWNTRHTSDIPDLWGDLTFTDPNQEKIDYLISKGWEKHPEKVMFRRDGRSWVTLKTAYYGQQMFDQFHAPKVDKQLEKDIDLLKNVSEKSPIARIILHLLNR